MYDFSIDITAFLHYGTIALNCLLDLFFVYFSVNLFQDKTVIWKFNPRTGEAIRFKEIVNKGIEEFKPEKWGRGNDVVLVFDNKEANFDVPGK